MFDPMRRFILSAASACLAAVIVLPAGATPVLQEDEFWRAEVERGDLPPVDERVPQDPMIVDLVAEGLRLGTPGGTLRTMVARSKDVRQMVVYGYARLVIYDKDYNLVPGILASVDNQDNKIYTLRLRRGHHWSDGHPFTSADFKYWWENVANNEKLSPSGPPDFLRVNGKFPEVTFPDETTIVYAWEDPNPNFLATLAQAAPPFIYRPAHFLKRYHEDFADPAELTAWTKEARVNSWAALHNKVDNMYQFDNHELPTLQPWMNSTSGKKIRHLFVRNPYYHRIDTNGVQLPYIDVVEMEIVSAGTGGGKGQRRGSRPAGPWPRFPRHLDPAQGRGGWQQLPDLSLGQRSSFANRDLSRT